MEKFAITKDNSLTVDGFEHKTLRNSDSTPVRARRTGKTQTWKTRPQEFKIPVKYGLKTSFYITEENAHEWEATKQ